MTPDKMKTPKYWRKQLPIFYSLEWTPRTIECGIDAIQQDALSTQSERVKALENQNRMLLIKQGHDESVREEMKHEIVFMTAERDTLSKRCEELPVAFRQHLHAAVLLGELSPVVDIEFLIDALKGVLLSTPQTQPNLQKGGDVKCQTYQQARCNASEDTKEAKRL